VEKERKKEIKEDLHSFLFLRQDKLKNYEDLIKIKIVTGVQMKSSSIESTN
jgi:hypothetical protein